MYVRVGEPTTDGIVLDVLGGGGGGGDDDDDEDRSESGDSGLLKIPDFASLPEAPPTQKNSSIARETKTPLYPGSTLGLFFPYAAVVVDGCLG